VLAGIRVLDATTNISGPSATMILAALGAEVIKIERPATGDDARAMAPDSAYFIAINCGKRSVALDLSKPDGVAVALRLAASCDVFIENFRGGKAESMGLGEPAIRAARADIIYASLSAFGPRGPDFEKPGYDALVQARTGIQSVTGEPGTAGARVGVSILDMGSGMWMALGVMAGLFDRKRTGRGTRVDGSLFQTGVMWMAYHLIARQMTGRDPRPQGTRHSAFAPYGDFATADSRILIGISNDRLFDRLCSIVALEPDPRFSTNAGRVEHRNSLDALLAAIFAQRTTTEWLQIFDRAGVPASAVQSAGDLLNDPQLAALAQMSEAIPGILSPNLPIEFSSDLPAQGPPPGLGEHTRAVLTEAGFDQREIESLAERRIIECLHRQKNSA
jgi:crotonobetainyl-CoA:carnitine CoA-transferase CaiB-like acyl-CoA transferase